MAGWLQLLLVIAILVAAYRPLGDYMAWALGSKRSLRVERFIYRVAGVNPEVEQRWTAYAISLLAFSLLSVLLLYVMQRTQASLPLSLGFPGVKSDQAFNTAISFVSNTNWQSYSGESTMGHLVQMAGLAVQNFVSAAVGIAVAVALIRGFTRREADTIGNFWADLVRSTIRILLPIAIVGAVVLISQGVVQNFNEAREVTTVQGAEQSIPGGPVASQEVIKELGTNGGGFYNANSAHPFENPNPFTNLLEIALLLVIPFALTGTFGKLVGNRKQGYVLAGVMGLLWLGSVLLAWQFESQPNRQVQAVAGEQVSGGNMEGKEVRFGVPAGAAFAASTTGTSTGSVNSAHDSMNPLGGGTVLVNIMLSEVSPGGVGSGLYGILVLAILAVFIAGLMVGRTPEYLGKKIEPREMKMVSVYILLVPAMILVLTGAAVVMDSAVASIFNPGPHGLSEILYAFTSGANNNGSAFGGLSANTPFFNTAIGFAMLFGRFASIVLVLAIAGSLARKKHVPESTGTFPTTSPLFVGLLTGVILIVTALTYFPALSLGPIVEGLS
ncbi:MAG TPA: potassium-transporting ATPase subunit KdpA [Actinomycetota bacterium]